MSLEKTIEKIADLEHDDVIEIDGVDYMVRDADPYEKKVKVAAGRTDPGTWVNLDEPIKAFRFS